VGGSRAIGRAPARGSDRTANALPVEQVNQSLGRLVQGRLIDAAETIDQGEYYMVRRLTHEGLRESGLWAKETDLANGIRMVLETEIKAASGDDKRRALLNRSSMPPATWARRSSPSSQPSS